MEDLKIKIMSYPTWQSQYPIIKPKNGGESI